MDVRWIRRRVALWRQRRILSRRVAARTGSRRRPSGSRQLHDPPRGLGGIRRHLVPGGHVFGRRSRQGGPAEEFAGRHHRVLSAGRPAIDQRGLQLGGDDASRRRLQYHQRRLADGLGSTVAGPGRMETLAGLTDNTGRALDDGRCRQRRCVKLEGPASTAGRGSDSMTLSTPITRHRVSTTLVLAVAALVCARPNAQDRPLPDFKAFTTEVKKHLQTDEDLQAGYSFTERETEQKLDGSGRVKDQTVKVFE